MLENHEVLVVVPRAELRDALVEFWREAGFAPVPVATAREARARLRAGPAPALVIVDLGSGAARSLHAWLMGRAARRRVPVVAIVRRAERVPGAFATVLRPHELASWLPIYERVRARLLGPREDFLTARSAA